MGACASTPEGAAAQQPGAGAAAKAQLLAAAGNSAGDAAGASPGALLEPRPAGDRPRAGAAGRRNSLQLNDIIPQVRARQGASALPRY